jgi:hypothetical protein
MQHLPIPKKQKKKKKKLEVVFHIVDCVEVIDFKSKCLSAKGFKKDLHVVVKLQSENKKITICNFLENQLKQTNQKLVKKKKKKNDLFFYLFF